MADDMRLRATVVDQASGPIREIGRTLREVSRAGSLAPLTREFNGLHQVVSTIGRELRTVTVPALGAMGLAGGGAVAGVIGITRALTGLAEKTLDLRYLSREVGIATGSIKGLVQAGEHFRIAPDAVIGGIKTFSRNVGDIKMNLSGVRDELLRHGAGDVVASIRRSRTNFEALSAVVQRMQEISRVNPEAGRRFAEAMFGDPTFARLTYEEILKRQKQHKDMTEQEAKAAERFNDNVNALSHSLSKLQRTIGNELMPVITPALEELNRFIEQNQGEIGRNIADTFRAIAAALNSVPWKDIADTTRFLIELSRLPKKLAPNVPGLPSFSDPSGMGSAAGAVTGAVTGALKDRLSRSTDPTASTLERQLANKERRAADLERQMEAEQSAGGKTRLRVMIDGLLKEIGELKEALRKLREEGDKAGDAVKKMNYSGATGDARIMRASYTPGLPSGGPGGMASPGGFGAPGGPGGFMPSPPLAPGGAPGGGPGGRAPSNPGAPPGLQAPPMGDAGASGPVGSLADARKRFAAEMEANPALRDRLMRLAEAEVGGQGPKAAQAFIESVMNRAAARGQTLAQAANDSGYYPGVSMRGKPPSDKSRGVYDAAIKKALDGSNVANYATGNASGGVGFNGGPQTYAPGTGERFGIEGPDMGWARRHGYGQPQPGAGQTQGGQPGKNGLVMPATGTLTSPFLRGRGGRRLHAGIDLFGKYGSPIVSSIDGKVIRNQWQNGYGHTVDILGSDGKVYRYAHLAAPGNVPVGGTVKAGQQFAAMGTSGTRSSGPHLHHEVRDWAAYQKDPFSRPLPNGYIPPGLHDPAQVYGIRPGQQTQVGTGGQPPAGPAIKTASLAGIPMPDAAPVNFEGGASTPSSLPPPVDPAEVNFGFAGASRKGDRLDRQGPSFDDVWKGRVGSLRRYDLTKPLDPSAFNDRIDRALGSAAGNPTFGVKGSASVKVEVNAPRGTKTSAGADGIFKSVEVHRATQMTPSVAGASE